jgi:hypothetical protein
MCVTITKYPEYKVTFSGPGGFGPWSVVPESDSGEPTNAVLNHMYKRLTPEIRGSGSVTISKRTVTVLGSPTGNLLLLRYKLDAVTPDRSTYTPSLRILLEAVGVICNGHMIRGEATLKCF